MNGQIVLNATLVTIIVSLFLPFVVGLVTKLDAPDAIKWVVLAFCSAVAALINTSLTLDGTAVISKAALVLAISTFLISTLTYLGLYKPIKVNAKLAPDKGLG